MAGGAREWSRTERWTFELKVGVCVMLCRSAWGDKGGMEVGGDDMKL